MAASLADSNPLFQQPVCQNCETSTTPLWRRDESGSVLCNACGLFLKLHGRPRPISLKTDVIKSRNRVKTANQGPKKQSLPASQSVDVMQNGTPLHHDPNIAPQHLFDGVSLSEHAFQAPALPNLGNHPSPGSMSFNQPGDNLLSVEQLIAQNTLLKTRVSELEVINMMYSDNENNLRKDRDEAVRAHEDLKRRFEELERSIQSSSDLLHPTKRQRLESDETGQQRETTTLQEDLAPALANE